MEIASAVLAWEGLAAVVLVVEDEAVLRMEIASQLRDAHLKVVEASTADEAWTYLESGQQADLLLTDIQIPGEMDGVQLAGKVAQRFPGIPIIVMSAGLAPELGHPGVFIPKSDLDRGRVVSHVMETLGARRRSTE